MTQQKTKKFGLELSQDGYRINMAMTILRDLVDSSLSSMEVEDMRKELCEALSILRRCEARNKFVEVGDAN